MTIARWTQGASFAAITAQGAILLDDGVLAERCYALLSEAGGFEAVLKELMTTAPSLKDLPAFALAVPEPAGIRVAVRGVFTVRGGEKIVDGGTALTWVEATFPAGSELQVGLVDGGFPTFGGIVPASGFTVNFTGGGVAQAPARTGKHAAPVSAPVAPAAPAPIEVPAPIELSSPDPRALDDARLALEDTQYPEPEPVAVPAQSDQPDQPGDPHQPGTPDQPAPEEEPADAAIDSFRPQPVKSAPVMLQSQGPMISAVPNVTPGGFAAATGPSGQMITGVPGVVQEPAQPGDHDGATIQQDVAEKLREEITEKPAAGFDVAEKTLSARCANGHPNPPHAVNCRECRAPVAKETEWLDRPTLGVLVASNGIRVDLDADVIVGRKPSSSPEPGRPRPHLLTLPSPDQQISRNHCVVRVDGWDMRLLDKNSNNGTFLLRAGQNPVRVSSKTPAILMVGDVIDVGEGLTLTVEAS